jgi:hypothetical protein
MEDREWILRGVGNAGMRNRGTKTMTNCQGIHTKTMMKTRAKTGEKTETENGKEGRGKGLGRGAG